MASAGPAGDAGVLPPLWKVQARDRRRPREGAKAGRRQPNHTLAQSFPPGRLYQRLAAARYNGPVVGGLGCPCGARAGLTT